MGRPLPDLAEFAQAMTALLRVPLQATHVQVLQACPAGPRVQYLHRGIVAPGLLPDHLPGWLIRLERDSTAGAALLVSSAQAGEMSHVPIQDAVLLSRLAWRLQNMAETSAMPDAMSEAIHALRNGLNSTVMNTALLATRRNDVPPDVQPALARIELAVARSADELRRLIALIECALEPPANA